MRELVLPAREGPPTGEAEDGVLVARFVADGDRGAFEALARRHMAAIRRFLALRLRDPAEIAEAEQEVLCRLYRSLPSFRGDSAFRTWLYRICALAAVDLARSRAREASRGRLLARALPDADPREADEAHYGLERAEGVEAVRRALAALGEPEASMLYLRDAEGVSVEEIGAVFGFREGTVKSRLSRARARMRQLLEQAERGAPGRLP